MRGRSRTAGRRSSAGPPDRDRTATSPALPGRRPARPAAGWWFYRSSCVQRAVRRARPVIRTLRLQSAETGPGAGAEDAVGGDVVHVDRDAQDCGQGDQVAADVAAADGAVIG